MEQTNERLNFWRDMWRAAAPIERPIIATLGRLIAAVETSDLPPDNAADIDELAKFTACTFSRVTPNTIATLEQRFIQKICPPNCYDSDGVITSGTGKRYRYVDIRQNTALPVEIKTAPIGDCTKCTYAKARGTDGDNCAKCQELNTYFEWTRAHLYTLPGEMAIHDLGLSPYTEVLKIGYDPLKMEIILPLDSRHYVTVELNDGDDRSNYGFVNLEMARKVLSHYNLQPRRNAESTLDGRCNYDTPYLDNRFVGTDGEIIFAGCIGQVYHKINLPFPPTEEIQILQPYKV